jgi:hypothetical protein
MLFRQRTLRDEIDRRVYMGYELNPRTDEEQRLIVDFCREGKGRPGAPVTFWSLLD